LGEASAIFVSKGVEDELAFEAEIDLTYIEELSAAGGIPTSWNVARLRHRGGHWNSADGG